MSSEDGVEIGIELPTKWKVLVICNIVIASLSLLGSVFIVTFFFKYKDLRTFGFKLIFMVTICDILFAAVQLLGIPRSGTAACTVQSFFITFSELGSMLWSFLISFTLHCVVSKSSFDPEKHLIHYHLFTWILAAVLSFVPFLANAYDGGAYWCRFAGDQQGNLLRFLCVYVPLALIILYITYVSWILHRHVNHIKQSSAQYSAESLDAMKRLRYYPLALVICYFWGFVNRGYTIAGHEKPVIPLVFLHILFSSLQGLLNALIYGFTPAVKEKFGFMMKKYRFDEVETGKSPASRTPNA